MKTRSLLLSVTFAFAALTVVSCQKEVVTAEPEAIVSADYGSYSTGTIEWTGVGDYIPRFGGPVWGDEGVATVTVPVYAGYSNSFDVNFVMPINFDSYDVFPLGVRGVGCTAYMSYFDVQSGIPHGSPECRAIGTINVRDMTGATFNLELYCTRPIGPLE